VNVFVDPEVIYTAADSPFQTLDDVIAEAKAGNGTWGAAICSGSPRARSPRPPA
jgi:tripartite-type tricarboxylate transporter receptor subunit TctC